MPPGAPYRQWAGDGDWVFVSLSEPGDPGRGHPGFRVLSASVHTPLSVWRGLSQEEYRQRKALWQARVEAQVERLIPGFRAAARFILGATPRTFQFYTGRQDGWVGGYPQVHPLRTLSPRTPYPNLWRVGRPFFPGSRCRRWRWGASGWRRWCWLEPALARLGSCPYPPVGGHDLTRGGQSYPAPLTAVFKKGHHHQRGPGVSGVGGAVAHVPGVLEAWG